MLPIIKRELQNKRWSLVAYSAGTIIMLWLYVATFRSSQASSQQLQEIVKTYPKALSDALGIGSISLDSLEKYLNAKHFSLIWPLLAIILALSRAAGQFAGEVQNGTLGLLLSLPISRLQLFIAKYCAGLLTIIAFCTVSVFGVIPLAAAYNIPSHIPILIGIFILTTLFMWAMYSLGLLVSTWSSEKGRVYTLGSAFLLLSYMIYIISLVSSTTNWLKNYSVFYYFNTLYTLSTGNVAASSYVVFGSIAVIASAISAWIFCRRDMSI